jgi:hypothetical protein
MRGDPITKTVRRVGTFVPLFLFAFISVSGNPFEDVEVTHVAGPTSGGSGGNIDMEDCSAPTYAGSFENRTQMNVLVGFGVHRYSVIAVDGNLRIGGLRQLCQSILRVELE